MGQQYVSSENLHQYEISEKLWKDWSSDPGAGGEWGARLGGTWGE